MLAEPHLWIFAARGMIQAPHAGNRDAMATAQEAGNKLLWRLLNHVSTPRIWALNALLQ